MSLYQHEKTGRLIWCSEHPGGKWVVLPSLAEYELPPNISDKLFCIWWEGSCVINGVRIGPKIDFNEE
jgi:hypothetical protein